MNWLNPQGTNKADRHSAKLVLSQDLYASADHLASYHRPSVPTDHVQESDLLMDHSA
jgi:hypothetical protein